MASITQRGKRWRAQVIKKGHKPIYKSFLYKADADKWAAETERAIERGEFVDMTEARGTTLSDALDRYLREITPRKKGKAQEEVRIKAWQKDALAARSLASIRGSDIAAWRDKRKANNKSPTTIRNDLAVISMLYEVASTEWGMEGLSNPVKKIKLPTLTGGERDRRLDPKSDKDGKTEESRLLEACAARPVSWLAPMVKLAIETAMRQGELLSLEWQQINLEGQTATLSQTKNDHTRTDRTEGRTIPLSKAAVATLRDLLPPVPEGVTRLPPRGPVFQVNTDKVVYEFKMACKAAKISGLRFHDLRHEAASRIFEKGFHPMKVAMITGHRNLQSLKRYTHMRPEDLAKELG